MPPRGRRRRNAVLAPMTRWLWWSPRHLFSAAAAALICIALLLAAFRPAAPPPRRHIAASSTPFATTRQSAPPQSSSPPPAIAAAPTTRTRAPSSTVMPPAASNPTLASSAAATWVRLWARPQLERTRWLREITPYTFRDFVPQIASINPANVPATSTAGPARTLRFTRAAAEYRVPVRGGSARAVDVTMIWWSATGPTAARWVVSAIAPVAH